MRSKSYLFLLLVLGLGIISGIFYKQTKYNFGLDVRGGVALTYEMVLTPEERKKAEEIRNRLIPILMARAAGSLAVAEPSIVPKGTDQIVIELPGATDVEKARQTIGSSAKIQFYWAKNVVGPQASARPYTAQDDKDPKNPTVNFRRTYGGNGEEIKYLGPDGKPNPAYADVIKGWQKILEGQDLDHAVMQSAGSGYQPEMIFSGTGAQKMGEWSRRYQGKEENIAAVLDGRVISLAHVQGDTILRDEAIINGTFPDAYVRNLVDLLNAGALPVDLKVLSSQRVEATIGMQALDKMVTAGVIAFGAISIFMLAYYAFPGLVAIIALALYVLFTLTVLKLANATFSLAGIAGFILSVGMAVDANILVFERFKEEMKRGKSLQTAIDLGFRRALPAIIDSNACTVLTSLVLAYLGTGPVKGFATTLIIGVVISLFTAVTVTRSLLVFVTNSGIADNVKLYAADRNWFKRFEERADTEPVEVVNKPARYFWLSAISIAVCLPFVFLGGLKPNVEFRGGYELQYKIGSKTMSADSVRSGLEKIGLRGANVKFGGEGADRVAMVTAPAEGQLVDKTPEQAQSIVGTAIGFSAADFGGNSFVGPAIQGETIRNAIIGVVLSSLLIVVYLALRFGFAIGGFVQGLRFGGSAIGALVHDVLFVVGFSAVVGFLNGWEISALFITSILTVIGFSVHDTIVIFDRIRENLRRPKPGDDLAHLMNRSITQSFARSLNTSMTVVLTLFIMLFAGTTTPDLKLFCATMLAGIISGTYSSIYNASPILYLWDRSIGRRKGEGETLLGKARGEAAKQRVITTQTVAPIADVPNPTQPPAGRSYGQVRRRANEPKKKPGHIEIEDDL
ncbi:protein translocase subunit SecD [Fimbriimonas ginsengisoli]|uniref:Multifunctional fusion protein n=1 Tax=Fimbriimonas ginsengisoli Gsoil 348 TaxID=661478 RepID=A0A068NUR8_FIMGI|nr:protein translocase subunit SecD [Fimbriimonas ginsengisoli]AIE87077.1 Protein-export membrane protein SecD [Fimbriimonas ginsengisoli Gsoil 348]